MDGLNGKVLVLGKGVRAFLAVIRSLGRRGLRVHTAWCPPGDPALASRYISCRHDLPRCSQGADAWLEPLAALLDQQRFDLVIPCNDEVVIPLQKHRATLERHARLALARDEAYKTVMDKSHTTSLARSLGVPVPREILLYDLSIGIGQLAASWGWPLVLKPRSSFSMINPVNKRLVQVVSSADQAVRLGSKMMGAEGIIIQEHISGVGVGVEVLADRGEILYAFQHERVHEPLSGGGSSYRVSVPLNPELLEATSALIRALQYTGVAMAEYRVQADRRKWVLLEINGRFWGSLPLAVAAGADFPWFLYQLLTAQKRSFAPGYRVGIYCRNLMNDLLWLRSNRYQEGKLAMVQPKPWGDVLREAGHVLALRERYDSLVLDDIRPAWVELMHRGARLRVHFCIRFFWRWPLRSLRAKLFRRRAARARHIHVVCKGNICRSPFLRAALAARAPMGVVVSASGYYPELGRCSPAEAIRAASMLGVDLSAHRSRLLSPTEIESADVIFVFDKDNLLTLRSSCPAVRRRVILVGQLFTQGPLEVADPFGGTEADFLRTYKHLALAPDLIFPAAEVSQVKLERPG